MRITEGRMMDLAVAATTRAQAKVAADAATMSSGIRVARPSDDPAAWVDGERAAARRTVSEERGTSIARAGERLDATDGALATIGSVLARARELAVQGANDTYGADERVALALEVRELRAAALAAANSRGSDGEYLLAGSLGTTAPFDPAGIYMGDASSRSVESSESGTQVVTIPGSVLTAASGGVDIFAVLDGLDAAFTANDGPAIRAQLDGLDAGVRQVSAARSDGGALSAALGLADEARGTLELNLTSVISRAVEADAFAAAGQLSRSAQALEAARIVAANVIELVRPR
jgi:flagellar hook-associated protein 3 FlgL